jgi:hypothetical protein
MPVFECARCNDMTYSAFNEALHSCDQCEGGDFRVIEGAFDQAREAARDLAPRDHSVLVYDEPGAVAPFCARYLTEGVNGHERVVAALPGDLGEEVRALLAPDLAVLVEWREPADVYGDFDPDRVAEAYDAMIAAHPSTTRILAGLDRAAAESVTPAEWDRYERLAHAIITSSTANVVCLYDTRAMPPELLDVAARRHGLAITDGVVRRNEQFEYAPA